MKIKIIGADAAFDGLNTSLFFTDDSGRGVLVDCGFTVFPELTRSGLREKVDVVLISHLHADHTGSLCTLAIWSLLARKKKIFIGGTDMAELFAIQGIHPDDYIPLAADDPLNIKTMRTGHIPGFGYNNALFIADAILYSGDSNESVLGSDYARSAKVIFHETTNRDSAAYAHAHLDVLNKAAPEVKAKTWLVHIEESGRAEIEAAAAGMGFAGVCCNGQEIEI